MFKIAMLLWIVVGAVLAGSAVVAVLATPSLAEHASRYIPMAGIGGYIVALPLSYLLASRLIQTGLR